VPSGERGGTNWCDAWTRIETATGAERTIRNAGSRINAMEAEDEQEGDDERLVREAETDLGPDPGCGVWSGRRAGPSF